MTTPTATTGVLDQLECNTSGMGPLLQAKWGQRSSLHMFGLAACAACNSHFTLSVDPQKSMPGNIRNHVFLSLD